MRNGAGRLKELISSPKYPIENGRSDAAVFHII